MPAGDENSTKTEKLLINQLRTLGVRPGGILLVHSSLRSLGALEDGAETVIRALLAAVGEEGLLLLPGLSYRTVHAGHPVFDLLETPVCVGALPEYFRRREGTLRSIHPTHSLCGVGKRAASLLGEHHLDNTPCGRHSPYFKLKEAGGQILFIGCGMRPNTSMHGVEELSEPPYLFRGEVDYEIHQAGRVRRMTVRSHHFAGYEQRYDRLAALLDDRELYTGKLLEADCHLVEAAPMWEKAHASLLENPFFFVDPIPEP